MQNLQQMWLNGNQLHEFDCSLFPALTLLNLDYNPLKSDTLSADKQRSLQSIKELGLRQLNSSEIQL